MADVIPSTPCDEGGTVQIEVNGAPVSDSNPMPVEATIDVGDITIGNVRIEGDTDGQTATVELPANITSADFVLGVHDPGPVNNQTADGAAVAGNPVRIGGKDGSGNTQDIITDTSGNQTAVGPSANLAAASGNPVPVGGTNNTVAPVVANGQRNEFQIDTSANLMATLATQIAGEDIPNAVMGVAHKPLAVTGYSWSVFNDASSATAFSLKASPGCIRAVRVTNANAAVRYLQFHNKASAPAAADAAFAYFLIPAGSVLSPAVFDIGQDMLGPIGDFLSTGVALGVSTTAATYTAATAADHQLTARYK